MSYKGAFMRLSPVFTLFCAVFVLAAPAPAMAQLVPAADLMPPPKAAPRTPVKSVRLAEQQRELKGQASAQDGGTIHLQTFDGHSYTLRLAGVIIAPLTDPKGIAARVALDELLQARTLSCIRRDRDTDGKLLVTCAREDGVDLSMQMLRDGVTLFTRNGNLSDEFVRAYRTAESNAQKERRGLWQNVPSLAVSSTKVKPITPVIIDEVQEQKPTTKIAAPESAPIAAPSYAPVDNTAHGTATNTPSADTATPPRQITSTSATLAAPVVSTSLPANVNATASNWPTAYALPTPEGVTDTMGFFFAASLIGTLLLGISLFDFLGRRRVRYAQEWEARHNRQIVAAALGGELAAARDVCESRAHSIANGAPAAWPRLRSYVYQTHVDKIGLLGPFLARQIATIYGQMSDYASASKDSTDLVSRDAMVKSLTRLCGYMDVALEGLAEVEITGDLPLPAIPVEYQGAQQRVTEARQRQAIGHKPAAAPPQQYRHPETHQPVAARQAQQPTPAKATRAPAARPQAVYPTYGEVAAQKIMEEEIIRARAEELLKAKASPMKRRAAAPKPTRDTQQDTHHADLLGLEDDAIEYVERPARGAKAKG